MKMKNRRRSSNLVDHLHNEKLRWNPWKSNRSKYFQERFDRGEHFSCRNVKGHSGCVNALDFSSDGLRLASGGDDKRVLIWNLTETLFNESLPTPMSLHATHWSNIFSIKFDNKNRRIISAGNDEQILIHDIEKQRKNETTNGNHSDELVDVFLESSPINCLSIQPKEDQIFIAATEDGHVHLYDIRTGPSSSSSIIEHDQPSIVVAESFDGSFHSCSFHPLQTCLVATASAQQGIELYDIRLTKSPVLRYGVSNTYSSRRISTRSNETTVEGMSVTFNSNGSLLFALRRRLPPVLFKLHQSKAFAQFDANNYVNLCTMKSGCFLGDEDQYVASGSDDFNVYVWRVPSTDDCCTTEIVFNQNDSHLNSDHFIWDSHLILRGHRSVVNQVRYSSRLHTIVSSGVEKILKIWTPYRIHSNEHQILGREEMFSHRDYLRAVLELGSVHHDSSIEHFDEDRRMLAFFDSLLQRELNDADEDDDFLLDEDSSDDDNDDDDEDDGNDVDLSSASSESDDQTGEELTLEEINSQTVDFAESTLSRTRHPTIVSLAENYRLNYVKMLREATGKNEKRALECSSPKNFKRQRSSSTTVASSNTLQRFRNPIRNEENEQINLNDERKC